MAAQVMLIFNETGSETSVTNYGTLGDPVVETESYGTATFSWNQDAAPYEGYLTFTVNGGGSGDMTIVDLSALSLPTDGDINCAIGFRIASVCSTVGYGYLHLPSPDSAQYGGISIDATDTTGDFTLNVNVFDEDQLPGFQISFTGLLYDTDYQLAVSIDISAEILRAALDAASTIQDTTGGASFDVDPWHATGGKIGTGHTTSSGWTRYAGTAGRYYYYYEERGTDVAWNDAECEAVNADPTTLDGWPSSGSIIPQAMYHYRNNSGSGL